MDLGRTEFARLREREGCERGRERGALENSLDRHGLLLPF